MNARPLRDAAFFFMIAAKPGAVDASVTASPAANMICPHFRFAAPAMRDTRRPPRRIDITTKETAMWYFTWILGIGVALGFGIINVMWLEANGKFARDPQSAGSASGTAEDTP